MSDINELKCYGDTVGFDNGVDENLLGIAIYGLKNLLNSKVEPIFGEEILFSNSDGNVLHIYPLKDWEIEKVIKTIYKEIEVKNLKKFIIGYKYYG